MMKKYLVISAVFCSIAAESMAEVDQLQPAELFKRIVAIGDTMKSPEEDRMPLGTEAVLAIEELSKITQSMTLGQFGELVSVISSNNRDNDWNVRAIVLLLLWQSLDYQESKSLAILKKTRLSFALVDSKNRTVANWWTKKKGSWKLAGSKYAHGMGGRVRMSLSGDWTYICDAFKVK